MCVNWHPPECQGFPAGHCIATRWSVLLTSPVSGSNVVTHQCTFIHTTFSKSKSKIKGILHLHFGGKSYLKGFMWCTAPARAGVTNDTVVECSRCDSEVPGTHPTTGQVSKKGQNWSGLCWVRLRSSQSRYTVCVPLSFYKLLSSCFPFLTSPSPVPYS